MPSPPPSKTAISATTGTDAPPKPPELADQLVVLFQLPGRTLTQKRLAAKELFEKNNEINKPMLNLVNFMNSGISQNVSYFSLFNKC
jgi:hypothetical protein